MSSFKASVVGVANSAPNESDPSTNSKTIMNHVALRSIDTFNWLGGETPLYQIRRASSAANPTYDPGVIAINRCFSASGISSVAMKD